MNEIRVNLHIHSRYSDGAGTHREIAHEALKSGLDAVIITDHNVWVQGAEGYHKEGGRKVLVIVGEELHDTTALPPRNHMLVFGAGQDLAHLVGQWQAVIDTVDAKGGATFIAHPFEHALPLIHEPAIPWTDWDIRGFTGLELWNGFSEMKSVSPSLWRLMVNIFFPNGYPVGPLPETLQKWDQLLLDGQQVSVVGGSDSHALIYRRGPLRKKIFPYSFHFKNVNTHIMLPEPLSGDSITDSNAIVAALRRGSCFIGYDRPAATDGFRFTAHGRAEVVGMGGELTLDGSATLQVRLPQWADCRLIHNGRIIRQFDRQEALTHITTEPGYYRVEAYLPYLGKPRGWIFSNPIYLRKKIGRDYE